MVGLIKQSLERGVVVPMVKSPGREESKCLGSGRDAACQALWAPLQGCRALEIICPGFEDDN